MREQQLIFRVESEVADRIRAKARANGESFSRYARRLLDGPALSPTVLGEVQAVAEVLHVHPDEAVRSLLCLPAVTC